MMITGFNDNDNMMLVVELMVVFVVKFAINKRAMCRTVCGLVVTYNMLIINVRFPNYYINFQI